MICTPAGAAGDTPQPGTSGGATAPVEGPALEAPALAPVPPLAPDAPKFRLTGCVATGPRRAIGTGPARKTVAIGFDDGPARITPAFVAMLEHAHARATFFVIGEQLAASNRTLLLRELHDGDTLGDHSFTHPFLTRTPDAAGSSRARSDASET